MPLRSPAKRSNVSHSGHNADDGAAGGSGCGGWTSVRGCASSAGAHVGMLCPAAARPGLGRPLLPLPRVTSRPVTARLRRPTGRPLVHCAVAGAASAVARLRARHGAIGTSSSSTARRGSRRSEWAANAPGRQPGCGAACGGTAAGAEVDMGGRPGASLRAKDDSLRRRGGKDHVPSSTRVSTTALRGSAITGSYLASNPSRLCGPCRPPGHEPLFGSAPLHS